MTNKCLSKSCSNNKALGDRLFCQGHREKWIKYCNESGVSEKQISTSYEVLLIKEFIDK